jgi:primosomal protein N'
MIKCSNCKYYIKLDSTKEKAYCKDCKLWTNESSRCSECIEKE